MREILLEGKTIYINLFMMFVFLSGAAGTACRLWTADLELESNFTRREILFDRVITIVFLIIFCMMTALNAEVVLERTGLDMGQDYSDPAFMTSDSSDDSEDSPESMDGSGCGCPDD